MSESTQSYQGTLRRGTIVIAILALLTIVEYLIAVGDVPGKLWWLLVAALAKGALIIQHFMHVGQLRRSHE